MDMSCSKYIFYDQAAHTMRYEDQWSIHLQVATQQMTFSRPPESYSIRLQPTVRESAEEGVCEVVDAALRRLAPKVYNICIIAVGKDARILKINRQQIAGPIARAVLVMPRSLAVAGQAMNEHNTEKSSLDCTALSG